MPFCCALRFVSCLAEVRRPLPVCGLQFDDVVPAAWEWRINGDIVIIYKSALNLVHKFLIATRPF